LGERRGVGGIRRESEHLEKVSSDEGRERRKSGGVVVVTLWNPIE
jgi:hypothetical protein